MMLVMMLTIMMIMMMTMPMMMMMWHSSSSSGIENRKWIAASLRGSTSHLPHRNHVIRLSKMRATKKGDGGGSVKEEV